jgi:hypothetical protein
VARCRSQQAADRSGAVQAPGARLGELAVDERQYLAAIGVQAGTDQARRGGEAGVFQVAQQRMHGWRPWPGVTDHQVAAAVDYRPATALQKNRIISRSHSSLSAASARLPTGFSGARQVSRRSCQ